MASLYARDNRRSSLVLLFASPEPGSLDQISEDVRGCAKIGASEVFFDPAFAPDGQSLDHWLSLLDQLRKYDYRYSQLTQVFGRLLYEKRLREEELRGLREDNLKPIRSLAKFLAKDAA
jgi:hypothetical protein